MAPKTLGESTRGRHSHSTLPHGATSAVVSQSDRKPYSAMGGKGEPAYPARLVGPIELIGSIRWLPCMLASREGRLCYHARP